MIKENCNNLEIILPKINRCLIDKENTYTLILRNNYTKRLHIFKVIDRIWTSSITVCRNPLRFHFEVCKPECFDSGEYTYYLASFGQWNLLNVDTNNVKAAQIKTRDEVLINGKALLVDGMVLVHHSITGVLASGDSAVYNDGIPLLVAINDHDLPKCGDLYNKLRIICTGILKYSNPDVISQCTAQPETDLDNFTQYGG